MIARRSSNTRASMNILTRQEVDRKLNFENWSLNLVSRDGLLASRAALSEQKDSPETGKPRTLEGLQQTCLVCRQPLGAALPI